MHLKGSSLKRGNAVGGGAKGGLRGGKKRRIGYQGGENKFGGGEMKKGV